MCSVSEGLREADLASAVLAASAPWPSTGMAAPLSGCASSVSMGALFIRCAKALVGACMVYRENPAGRLFFGTLVHVGILFGV